MRSAAAAALAAAIGLPYCACALAQPMSRAEYQAARRTVESDFRTARIGCEPMRGNVRDICMADVTGREGIRLAELEAVYARQGWTAPSAGPSPRAAKRPFGKS